MTFQHHYSSLHFHMMLHHSIMLIFHFRDSFMNEVQNDTINNKYILAVIFKQCNASLQNKNEHKIYSLRFY